MDVSKLENPLGKLQLQTFRKLQLSAGNKCQICQDRVTGALFGSLYDARFMLDYF